MLLIRGLALEECPLSGKRMARGLPTVWPPDEGSPGKLSHAHRGLLFMDYCQGLADNHRVSRTGGFGAYSRIRARRHWPVVVYGDSVGD